MKIQIDENNYIMGYATVGEITEGIDVEYDEAVFEYGFAFYKYENGNLIRIPDFNESLMSVEQIGRNTGFLLWEKRVIVIKEISGAEEEVWWRRGTEGKELPGLAILQKAFCFWQRQRAQECFFRR